MMVVMVIILLVVIMMIIVVIVMLIPVIVMIVMVGAASRRRHQRGESDRSRQGCFEERDSLHTFTSLSVNGSLDPFPVQVPGSTF
jgi:hypothetical protein